MDKKNLEGINELIKEIVSKCEWKKEVFGVDICNGNCIPCKNVITSGQCDALIKVFGKVTDD